MHRQSSSLYETSPDAACPKMSQSAATALIKARFNMSPPVMRVATVLMTLVVLELGIFLLHFTGAKVPPWDFFGSYNTYAFLWWQEGSFFSPIDWVSSSLAGYPAALMIQGSSWYLPVGVVTLFGPFTLHSSAVLYALHVAFGSCGTYVLVRSLKMPFSVAMFAAVAGFFAAGYFSNAQHLDIVRGYAWAPWVLFVLSPHWPWGRIWSVPLAAGVLWQAATGAYPGMIFSTVYIGLAWIAVYQWQLRPSLRTYIVPLFVSATAAAFLCGPRLIPYILLSGDTAGRLLDASTFNPAMIGTLLFGYGNHAAFSMHISMSSFFLPATVLSLCWFADMRQVISKLGLAIGLPAFALGMPFLPWFESIQSWPGLGLSRFTMSDFKVFILLAVVLLACSGMQHLLRLQPMTNSVFSTRFLGAAALALVLLLVGVIGPFPLRDWLPGYVILVLVLALILSSRFNWMPAPLRVTPVLLVVFTMASGALWAHSTREPWNLSRITAEVETYGATVDELISMRSPATEENQRPARTPLPHGYNEKVLFSQAWNGSYYSGKDTLGGYVNLKGSETVDRLTAALLDPVSGTAFAEFLSAPGLLLEGGAAPDHFRQCARAAACGDALVEPAGYTPGNLKYQISSEEPFEAVLNEAYYAGWQAQVCDASTCRALSPSRGNDGLIQVSLPDGEYTLELLYRAPGRDTGWAAFALGNLVMACGMLIRSSSGRGTGVIRERPLGQGGSFKL